MEVSATREAISCAAATDSFPAFYETWRLLPHSQELSTFPYPEPDQSGPTHPILSLQNPP
jgi:hypothetical protein